MSSIVKYTRKNGLTVAYESIARWDPVKKRNRPIRKYLGTVDPLTGEIIPSSGKRGRPAGSKNRPRVKSVDAMQGSCSAENVSLSESYLVAELKSMEERISAIQAELDSLRKRNIYLEKILFDVTAQLLKAVR